MFYICCAITITISLNKTFPRFGCQHCALNSLKSCMYVERSCWTTSVDQCMCCSLWLIQTQWYLSIVSVELVRKGKRKKGCIPVGCVSRAGWPYVGGRVAFWGGRLPFGWGSRAFCLVHGIVGMNTPPVNRQTRVKTLPFLNFVCGGKKRMTSVEIQKFGN